MVGGPKPISRTGYHHPQLPIKEGEIIIIMASFTQDNHHHHHHLPASQGGRGGGQADRQRGRRVAHRTHLGAKQVRQYLLSIVDNIDMKK